MQYHKDIDCNGRAIYYRLTNSFRFVRASREKAELEIKTGAADVTDYAPNKPLEEMTDWQVRAKLAQSVEFESEAGIRMAKQEMEKRGIK